MASSTSTAFYYCSYCGCGQDDSYTAPSLQLLNQHIRLGHSNDPNFLIHCPVPSCQRTFRNYRTYQNHVLAHRENITYRKSEIFCKLTLTP